MQDNVTVLLFAIFAICGLGLIIILFWLSRQVAKNRITGRVDTFVGTPIEKNATEVAVAAQTGPYIRSERFEGLRGKLNNALAFFSTLALQQKISSAYWPISDVEFIFIRIAATIIGFVVGTIIPHSIIGGLGLGLLFYLIPGLILDRSIMNRRKKFHEQLLDFLILVKGAVLAGYSLHQALDLAINESVPPASEEFGRVLREVRFGFPLDQALMNLRDRMSSDDLQIVVTAIVINTQVGGSLATVLEAVIDTIRERIHLFGEIRSLTSYARWVGTFLTFMPFITALLIFLVSPGYFAHVKDSIIVQIIFGLALIGILLGNFFIRRIIRIKV